MEPVEQLLRKLERRPEVQTILEVAGPFDLLVLVVVANMDAFNAFADAMLGSDPAVRRYETRFVKRRRKFTTAWPISSD